MTTSGTYTFNPALGSIVVYAYQLIGVRPTALLQEHMETARMAANMIQSRWVNQGVNLWQVELVETPLVAGQSSYAVDATTVVILDAYVVAGGTDRIILPVSRSEYASYPNKSQQGVTTVFWFDRLLEPIITLWPVPDGQSATTLKYYRLRQAQDAVLANGTQVDLPMPWLEAFADALAYRLARIWAPGRVAEMKMQADDSYKVAAEQNIEQAATFITPSLGGYYR